MQALNTCRPRPLMKLKFCHSNHITLRHQKVHFGYRTIKQKNLPAIPNAQKMWAEYRLMELSRARTKKLMLDELFEECNIPQLMLTESEKINIFKVSIDKLIQQNLVPNISAVVDELLSHLEPFPFNKDEIVENEDNISLNKIQNIIKKQYLAWKFKSDINKVKEVFSNFKLPIFQFQSMRSIRRNVQIIENLAEKYQISVAEKIYHIHQIPFNPSLMMNFQESFLGLNWVQFSAFCPKLLKYSYQYILFLISHLREMKFREAQIREGLPSLYQAFFQILYKLNSLLSQPEISKHRNEDKFLQLLFLKGYMLTAGFAENHSFSEMLNLKDIQHQGRVKSQARSILQCVRQHYNTVPEKSCLNNLRRTEMWKFVSESQVLDTLEFLQSKDFKATEIEESIGIILYPRELIEKGLKKVEEEESKLNVYGFKGGFVPESTNFFTAGTKSENKILQLCLYYIGKKV